MINLTSGVGAWEETLSRAAYSGFRIPGVLERTPPDEGTYFSWKVRVLRHEV